MVTNNPYQQYQQNSIMTARPEELTLMLYNGAVKFLKLAKAGIENNDYPNTHNNIIKAEEIVRELMCTLDMQYEISQSMYQLYDFMYNWLVQANIKKDEQGAKMIDDVIGLMEELRDTWVQMMKIVKEQKTG